MATMTRNPATLEEIIDRINETWRDWVMAVEAVPADRRADPGVCGYWSLKDLISHISLWEHHLPEHVQRWRLGLPRAPLDVDDLNAEIVREQRDRSFGLVIMEMHRAHQLAMAVVESISGDLDEDIRERISCETWDHYPGHTDQINAWLANNGEAGTDPQVISGQYADRVNRALVVIKRIPAETRDEGRVTEQWSVKDVVAHCAYWDGVQVGKLETEFAGGTILEDDRAHDVINAEQFQIRSSWNWQKVLDEAMLNRDRRANLLLRPSQFDQSGSGEHWDEHRAQIETWLAAAAPAQ